MNCVTVNLEDIFKEFPDENQCALIGINYDSFQKYIQGKALVFSDIPIIGVFPRTAPRRTWNNIAQTFHDHGRFCVALRPTFFDNLTDLNIPIQDFYKRVFSFGFPITVK